MLGGRYNECETIHYPAKGKYYRWLFAITEQELCNRQYSIPESLHSICIKKHVGTFLLERKTLCYISSFFHIDSKDSLNEVRPQ